MPDTNFNPDSLLAAPAPPNASMTIRPRKLDRADAEKLVRKYNPDITPGAVAGEVDNVMRESGGDAGNKTGDGGTSGGLYQHHNKRLTGLKAFATEHRKDWTDPEIQVQYSRLEKERDYPSLLKLQQTSDDRGKNEDAFKRIFERPASVLWGNDATGHPLFSDFATKEHAGRKDTDLLYMTPAEYLDLSPELEGKPFESPSGRSLMKSFRRGDQIEAVPTLDVEVKGPTATVTDQDGRHRALLAQQEGLEAIPVAVRRTGEGEPKEIVGRSGTMMAHDFPKVADVQARRAAQTDVAPPKEPISLFQQVKNAVVPGAEAAEPGRPAWMANDVPVQQTAPQRPAWMANDVPAGGSAPAAEPDGAIVSGLKGAAKGFGDTVLAGQELVGKGMEAVGVPGGETLVSDARSGMANLQKDVAPDRAAHPWATGIGDFLGGMVIPGGVAGKVATNALRGGAVAGALSGLLTPGNTPKQGQPESFWRDKVLESGVGAATGVAAGKVGNALSKAFAPSLRATVEKLMGEGVELTPGQMAGGAAKRAEDALGSIPLLGSAIRAAQRRSIQTFNRAAINRSLDDIGVKLPQGVDSGHDAISFAQDAFTQAYDHVVPRMRGREDPEIRNDMLGILNRAAAENLPQEFQDQLKHIVGNEVVSRFNAGGGQISGTDAKKIGTQLDTLIKTMRISPNPYVQHLGRFVRDVDAALDNMMERQNPILQAAKDRIDAGYAKFKTVQSAASAVGTHADGTFTPAQLNRAVKARDTSKDKAAFARGDALMQDLATAARDVLPQTVPDSGTPERAALMAGIGGAGVVEPYTALGLAALAVPYTAPISKAMNYAINKLAAMPFPKTQNALANIARVGGGIGAPVAGSMAASSEQSKLAP